MPFRIIPNTGSSPSQGMSDGTVTNASLGSDNSLTLGLSKGGPVTVDLSSLVTSPPRISIVRDDLMAQAAAARSDTSNPDPSQTLNSSGGNVNIRADHNLFWFEIFIDSAETGRDNNYLIQIPREAISTTDKTFTTDTNSPQSTTPNRDVEITVRFNADSTLLMVTESGISTTDQTSRNATGLIAKVYGERILVS